MKSILLSLLLIVPSLSFADILYCNSLYNNGYGATYGVKGKLIETTLPGVMKFKTENNKTIYFRLENCTLEIGD